MTSKKKSTESTPTQEKRTKQHYEQTAPEKLYAAREKLQELLETVKTFEHPNLKISVAGNIATISKKIELALRPATLAQVRAAIKEGKKVSIVENPPAETQELVDVPHEE